MALARSASGPGGLSINIGSANAFGSSNNTSQPAASGGLFGQATMSQPTGGLFGAAQPQTTQAGGGLFGAKTSTTQPAATGGLFGGLATPATTKPGGLFGTATTTTQPQQTSGLFGNLSTPAATQAQAPATGGLFGSTMGQQQPQQPSGGLFGNVQTQAKPSLFGTTTTAQQPAQQTSLFGTTARPAQPTTGFGSTLPGGGLTLGQPQAQQAQTTVPGVRIDMSNIRITTRFNDLNEELQKQIEQADATILGIISRATECTAILPAHGDSLDLIPDNVEFLQRKLIGVQANLDADVQTVSQVGKQVRVDIENAKLSFAAIENLKLPAQFHQGMWSAAKQPSAAVSKPGDPAGDLVTFFSQTAEEMDRTLTTYKDNISEIEQHLRGVERSLMQAAHHLRANGQDGNEVEKLVGVLKDFEYGILEVASKVGGAKEAVKRLELNQFLDPAYVNVNGKRTGVY